VSENYGESELAKRFGVTRYPAIFVDDVLVATPKDFGFFGKGEGKDEGRYAPLRSAASHERLRSDLSRMISLTLAGKKAAARAVASPSKRGDIESLPPFEIVDIDGKHLAAKDLAGRVVLVEFWATWCPPCRRTLAWLGEIKKRYGDRIAIVAVAIESDEPNIRKLTKDLGAPLFWTIGTPDLVRSFGDIGAVPTLFLFDQKGRTVSSFFGAPPTLHASAEGKIKAIVR
jgi:thiol-disulfide isomerase/thioredoxin